MNALRLLWLRWQALEALLCYENQYALQKACLDDLERIRPQVRRAQAELEAANFQVSVAELTGAKAT